MTLFGEDVDLRNRCRKVDRCTEHINWQVSCSMLIADLVTDLPHARAVDGRNDGVLLCPVARVDDGTYLITILDILVALNDDFIGRLTRRAVRLFEDFLLCIVHVCVHVLDRTIRDDAWQRVGDASDGTKECGLFSGTCITKRPHRLSKIPWIVPRVMHRSAKMSERYSMRSVVRKQNGAPMTTAHPMERSVARPLVSCSTANEQLIPVPFSVTRPCFAKGIYMTQQKAIRQA